MEDQTVKILLPDELFRAGKGICQADDITIGQLVRHLLAKEITRRRKARPSVRADEQLLAPLRERLAPHFAAATNWNGLQIRLNKAGYVLRPAGGGLALHTFPAESRVCKASELGFSYSRLIQRFKAAFPGHAHTWLADRILEKHADDIEFCVVERF